MGYVVHKEAVRQLFIDGFGNFLFDMKKTIFPPLPFCIGSYKFTKVKSETLFVKYLGSFHFGEKSFCKNDAYDKVAKHCAFVGVHFEYSHHWEKNEEVYKNMFNMTTFNKKLKNKITTTGGKGSGSFTSQKCICVCLKILDTCGR